MTRHQTVNLERWTLLEHFEEFLKTCGLDSEDEADVRSVLEQLRTAGTSEDWVLVEQLLDAHFDDFLESRGVHDSAPKVDRLAAWLESMGGA